MILFCTLKGRRSEVGGTGAQKRSVLLATFVQREICGTDSSCLPTTVGHVERCAFSYTGKKKGREKQDRAASRRGALAQASSRTFLIKLHFRLGNFLWSYKKAGTAAAAGHTGGQSAFYFAGSSLLLLYLFLCRCFIISAAATPLPPRPYTQSA